MDLNILKKCNNEGQENSMLEEEALKFKLNSVDEISLDSIFSALLDRVEPLTIDQLQALKFEVPEKDLLNEKQAIVFEERLYISKLKDNCSQLNEDSKVFLENDLEEIGTFKFSVAESYDGFVVYARSKLLKERGKFKCGHWLRGKYDDKLNLIYEKRTEYDFVDNARVEKSLDGRLTEGKLILKRGTKINNDGQFFKAAVRVKDQQETFLLDGGILLLMRYLIASNFRGDFSYFTMNVQGKMLRCQLTIQEERKQIKMFHRTFTDAIQIRNIQYINDSPQEISDTYYSASGKMILHYWHNFNYLIHETKGFIPKREAIVPKLELMWRCQNQLLDQYRSKRKLATQNAMEYFGKHSELSDILHDYVLNVLKYKPNNLLEFTVKYFQNFKTTAKKL